MMNQVGLVGRLARDPELREVAGGTKKTDMVLAVERDYTNQEGEREADFINVGAWRKLAEQCAEFLAKGSLVAVKGRMEVNSWEDKETGERRYKTEVISNQVKFLDRPQNDNNSE